MPVPPVLTIDERIAHVVEQHRDELLELVRHAVDRELADLVAADIGARNGVTDAPATKLCAVCGQEPRLPNRRVGRSCHAARQRERRERRVRDAADGDGERPRRGPDVAGAEPA